MCVCLCFVAVFAFTLLQPPQYRIEYGRSSSSWLEGDRYTTLQPPLYRKAIKNQDINYQFWQNTYDGHRNPPAELTTTLVIENQPEATQGVILAQGLGKEPPGDMLPAQKHSHLCLMKPQALRVPSLAHLFNSRRYLLGIAHLLSI